MVVADAWLLQNTSMAAIWTCTGLHRSTHNSKKGTDSCLPDML
jgi:hypothetical protein